MTPSLAAISSTAAMLGKLGSIQWSHHLFLLHSLVSAGRFHAPSAQHLASYLGYKLTPPTHACIFRDSSVTVPQLLCRPDRGFLSDGSLLHAVTDDSGD